jgi:hypothetical protein
LTLQRNTPPISKPRRRANKKPAEEARNLMMVLYSSEMSGVFLPYDELQLIRLYSSNM